MARPRTKDQTKFCQHCGIQLLRKTFNGRLEDATAFQRRKFCSLTCANSKRVRLTKHGYSWRARKHLKPACEACGQATSLHAHHLDQDNSNNAPENIQTLCKPCHDFWHSTAKRHGRFPAGKMPQLYLGATDGK